MPVIPFRIRLLNPGHKFVSEGRIISTSNKCGAFFCRGGKVVLTTCDGTFTLGRDTVYIYAGASSVTVRSISPDASGYLAEFDISRLVNAINKVMDAPNILMLRDNPMLHLSEAEAARIDALAAELIDDMQAFAKEDLSPLSGRIRREIILAKSEILTYSILDIYFNTYKSDSTAIDRRSDIFRQFMLALYRDFRSVREVEEYASRQFLSARYFSSIIKEKSGMLPSDIISDLVIAEARQMLADPRMSVKQIALALNFPSQSFFGKYFKRRTGMSPRHYRESLAAAPE